MANETKIPGCSHPTGHEWINLGQFGENVEGVVNMEVWRCKHCYLIKRKISHKEKKGIL